MNCNIPKLHYLVNTIGPQWSKNYTILQSKELDFSHALIASMFVHYIVWMTDDLPLVQSSLKLYKLTPLQSRHNNANLPQIQTRHTFFCVLRGSLNSVWYQRSISAIKYSYRVPVPNCEIKFSFFALQYFHDHISVEHDEKPSTQQILYESVHGGPRYDCMKT